MMRKFVQRAVVHGGRFYLQNRALSAAASSRGELVRRIGIIGVPLDKGQKVNTPVHEGPKSIRDGGLISSIRETNEWTDFVDYGDIEPAKASDAPSPPNMHNFHAVMNTMGPLSDRVLRVLQDGRLCITLGGDHSIAIGTLDGHLRHDSDAVVFWIDAHTDLNTNGTSLSGSMHGMSVAVQAKELRQHWPDGMAEAMGVGWQPK